MVHLWEEHPVQKTAVNTLYYVLLVKYFVDDNNNNNNKKEEQKTYLQTQKNEIT